MSALHGTDSIRTAPSMELASLPVKDGFRMRGESISRLETFVDSAFAFAVTLLVISIGTVPKSVPELLEALERTPAFAACFALVAMFWLAHNRWSRRYGLDDAYTTFLSLVLVFVTLVFVYPLRMVISSAIQYFTGGAFEGDLALATSTELNDAFLIYGIGWTLLSAITWIHFAYALGKARELGLDEVELLETRRDAWMFLGMAGVGVLSIASTILVRGASNPLSAAVPGFVYGLIGVAQPLYHARFNRARARLDARAA